MTVDWLLNGFVMLLAGAAVWGGIRADIRNQRESVAAAHRRIDNHLENHK